MFAFWIVWNVWGRLQAVLNSGCNIFETYKDICACVHFAAYKSVGESIENPEKYYKNNIGSTEVLLKCLEVWS